MLNSFILFLLLLCERGIYLYRDVKFAARYTNTSGFIFLCICKMSEYLQYNCAHTNQNPFMHVKTKSRNFMYLKVDHYHPFSPLQLFFHQPTTTLQNS